TVETNDQVAAGAELIRLARESRNEELIFWASLPQIGSLLRVGRIEEADAEIGSFTRRAQESRQPATLWSAMMLRTMRATLDGRLEEGERLEREKLALGRRRRERGAS